MQSDYKPILFQTNPEFEEIEIYFVHDMHYGSEDHDKKKWESLKREILSEPNRYVIFVGDYCENAVVGSKSDIYTQTASPFQQKEWFTEQLRDLKDRTVCVVPGNHEDNRITKLCGLFPVYDCAKEVGIGDLYRHHFAIVDIAVGSGGHGKDKQAHYVGYIVHRLRDCKMYNGSDFVDGIDFACYGHDHDPKDHPRAKLVYDAKNKAISIKNIEVINCGSFMTYGGYGAKAGYRPLSSKVYKLVLAGKQRKSMKTVGFCV
jgi:predicted MPP superfamily phosphohydrolase